MVRKKKRTNFIDQLISRNMRRLRKESGWTQEELARRYGCSHPHISQLESGHRGFGVETQEHLAKALGVEIKELLEMPKGLGSEDMEVLWERFNEVRTGARGKLFDRLMNILSNGPDEAVESLDGMSKLLEKSIKKEG